MEKKVVLAQQKATGLLTKWWWVRHAPPEIAIPGYIYGSTNFSCDCSNTVMFSSTVTYLPAAPTVVIYTPLQRTWQTLQALLSVGWLLGLEQNIPLLMEPAFAEQNFGLWEGKSWNMLAAVQGLQQKLFWSNPFTTRAPLGESFYDVFLRVQTAITNISREYQGQTIVSIAHAGSIRAAIAYTLNLTLKQAYDIVIHPLSVTYLGYNSRDKTWNARYPIL